METRNAKPGGLFQILFQENPAGTKCARLPRLVMPLTLLSSFKNSTAIVSGAGEKVRILWITLVVAASNFELDEPILTATPKGSSDCWAAVLHSEMRYWHRMKP